MVGLNVVKKGADIKSKFGKDVLQKINLCLLVAVLIILSVLLYSTYEKGSSPQTQNIVNNVYEHLGDQQILITNSTTNQGSELCYMTYVCVNNTAPSCESSCIETNSNQDCLGNNSLCCSGCCKYNLNGGFRCVSESGCSQSCRQESQTCSGITAATASAVAAYNSNANNYSCCPGLTCLNGICKKQCAGTSMSCTNTSDCCSSLTCLRGLCSSESCVPETQTCIHDSDCCSGLDCTNGLCTRPYCAHLSETCGYGTDCCSGLFCGDNHFCQNSSFCAGTSQTCSDNSDCCAGLTCQYGLCYYPVPAYCANVSQTCFGNSDCCTGLTCQYGFCQNCVPYKQTCLNNSWCCSGICTNSFCDD